MNDANTMTLEEAIIAKKCRKGKAYKITGEGAYWLAGEARIGSAGGDGIGQSGADISYELELRHYRGGEVRAAIIEDVYHQNYRSKNEHDVSGILELSTLESIHAQLLLEDLEILDYDGPIKELRELICEKLGLPDADASPDEER